VKVVVIGGSAHSTPALFDTNFAFGAPEFSFELIGRSPARLAAVVRASQLVAANRGWRLACRSSSFVEVESAVADADAVVVQFRVGGYEARTYDETFPHRYGLCGDEGLGPGGLACAWRTWNELRRTLSTIERVNTQAIVLLLTSPVSILTRCAQMAFPDLRIYGICELPWTTLRDLCVPDSAAMANYAYLAVNHLGWFSDVRCGDRTVVAPDDVHALKYVRLHDSPSDVLQEQRVAGPRGRKLEAFASDAFEAYENGSPAMVLSALRRRQTPWYRDAVAPLLRSIAGYDTGVTYFLSTKNAGYCSLIGDDEIIEMPFLMRNGGLERRDARTWRRDDVAAGVRLLVNYERMAATAIVDGNETALAAALRAHPWLDGVPILDQLVADIVASPKIRKTSPT
jgi:6-phospho-beta-glucosidase